MALTRYDKIQFRYNTTEDVEIKDYLPITGKDIPSKTITYFDSLTEITFARTAGATAADLGLDSKRAYRSDYCRGITLSGSGAGIATITVTPAESLDLTSLSTETNDFAQITHTGKYGVDKDQLWFNLLVQHYWTTSSADNSAIMSLKFYNGTKTATQTTPFSLTGNYGGMMKWRYQVQMDSDSFTYAAGFTAADWETITSYDIVLTEPSAGTGTGYFYFHDAVIALPRQIPVGYSGETATDGYYPAVSSANSIYVSQLFGDDGYNGETFYAPVRTIERAIELATTTRTYICLLDSGTYKPVARDYSYVGIQQTINNNYTIIADYLETPKISSAAGICDAERIGARTSKRNKYGDVFAPDKTLYTVGTGGTYSTIGAAYAAATTGGVIEIIDSAIYDEALTVNNVIYIQAAPGQVPVWKNTSGATIVTMFGSSVIHAWGISFQGRNTAGDKLIVLPANGTIVRADFSDCTFSKCGSSSGASEIIQITTSDNAATSNVVSASNCIFSDCGECCTAIDASNQAVHIVKIVNSRVYLGNTGSSVFMKQTSIKLLDATSYTAVVACDIIGASDVSDAMAYTNGTEISNANATTFRFLLNDSNCSLNIGSTDGFKFDVSIQGNYFHDNISAAEELIRTENNTTGCTLTIKHNMFFNIGDSAAPASCRVIYWKDNYNNLPVINYNKFIDCNATCIDLDQGPDTGISLDYNLFYGCTKCFYLNTTQQTVNYCVLSNNTACAQVIASTLTFSYCIMHDSPDGGGGITHTNEYTYDPLFIDPNNLDLSWDPTSQIEDYFELFSLQIVASNFIFPTGTGSLMCKFVDFVGSPGWCVSSINFRLALTYCAVSGFTCGILSTTGTADIAYCEVKENGIGIKISHSVRTAIDRLTNCMIENNNVGVLLKSGCTLNHCTIIDNGYGLTILLDGFYDPANSDYMSLYITITNSIVFDNSAYDYYGKVKTDYCCIGSRYYDQLPESDLLYINTIGDNDVSDNPKLTGTYSFPALKVLGFRENSPCYNAASTATQNIGARYINGIKAAPSYSSYTLLANPQESSWDLSPVNLEDGLDASGYYDANSDIDALKLTIGWTEPGRYSKILAAQQTAMKYIYQTYWIVGISQDGGSSWTYYKVNKSANPAFKQVGYYYHELPVGEWTMEFYKMPDVFDITDYTVDTFA